MILLYYETFFADISNKYKCLHHDFNCTASDLGMFFMKSHKNRRTLIILCGILLAQLIHHILDKGNASFNKFMSQVAFASILF